MGEWRYSSIILDLGTRCRWMVSFKPWPLYPRRQSPRYLLDRMLCGPQSRSGVKKKFAPAENRISAVQPFAIPTELSRFLIFISWTNSWQDTRFVSSPPRPDWRVNQPKHEADHSPLSTAKIKNEWSSTSTPTYVHHGVMSQPSVQKALSYVTRIRFGLILTWKKPKDLIRELWRHFSNEYYLPGCDTV
jgi:hypothetical protein